MTDKKEWEVCYRRQMGQNEMMICVDSRREGYYETRMLKNNEIPGLLKFSLRRMDDKCWFCYQITSRQPLARLLETQMLTKDPIRRILYGMIQAFMGLGEYLLSEEQILLEPEFIYINLDDWTPKLCLMPGKEGNFSGEFSKLLQFLLEKTDHRDKEAVTLIYSLYRESLKENYGFKILLELLEEPGQKSGARENPDQKPEKKTEMVEDFTESEPVLHRPERETQAYEKNSGATLPVFGLFQTLALFPGIPFLALLLLWIWKGQQGLMEQGKLLAVGATVFAAVLAFLRLRKGNGNMPAILERLPQNKKVQEETGGGKEEPPSWTMLFEAEQDREEPDILQTPMALAEEDNTHTTLLWSQPEAESGHRLVSTDEKNGDIEIGYYPFLIGKQESLSDYILNQDTVSRLHVRLDRDGEICRLTDLNSTNGTSVNGRRLEANETVELKTGDEVLIADQRFRFQ